MPVEIRELIIRTDIRTHSDRPDASSIREELKQLKTQISAEVRKEIAQKTKRQKYQR